jgi:signal transduction histidine kinase
VKTFRSVGFQLSLAVLIVLTLALGIVYLMVVPSLQGRLVDRRVAQLEQVAEREGRAVEPGAVDNPDDIAAISARSGARAFLVQQLVESPVVVRVLQDSLGGQNSSDVEDDGVAVHALTSGRPQHGIVHEGDQHFAEAAVPVLGGGGVLVLRNSIQNQVASVDLVKRRLLFAAALALVVALLVALWGARMFAARIRKLERAADRIASGRFDEPVHDAGGGELGALAEAFERMRVRLAQLDDARREFVANASHELRTPLFSLVGFLELLDDEDLDEPTRQEFLTSMREQVERLTKLAASLLDLTRLDAGRLTVEREPVDLASIADELAVEFRPLAGASGHSLAIEAPEPVFAESDELRTLQIGRILVENALLHTPEATAVRVTVRRSDGSALLEVENDGPEIPDEQREQLFERFYRLEGTRASGSGLGLAIARELAGLMEGTVEADSRRGKTTFTLALPAAPAEEAEAFSREIGLPAGT